MAEATLPPVPVPQAHPPPTSPPRRETIRSQRLLKEAEALKHKEHQAENRRLEALARRRAEEKKQRARVIKTDLQMERRETSRSARLLNEMQAMEVKERESARRAQELLEQVGTDILVIRRWGW